MTDRTLVTFLLDRSGSMQSIIDDTIGGFNAYLDGLRAAPNIEFTLVQFDSVGLEKTCLSVPAAEAPQLSKTNFMPRASTPLIDAAYKTIKAVETSLAEQPAAKVVICIQTDGHENCSTQHTWIELNALIKEKSEAGWEFNFLGAGIDAYNQASLMGISRGKTMSYDSSDAGATRAAFSSRGMHTAAYAAGDAATMDISFHEKAAAGDKFDPDAAAAGKPAAASRVDRKRTVAQADDTVKMVNDLTL